MEAKLLEDTKAGNKSITTFIKPLDVKGTKLLTWTSKVGDNKQWLYLPRFKRVKKINSKNQTGSFMGSEFSYEDIAGNDINKYKYKLLSENKTNWVVESVPTVKSGYTKTISTINKTTLHPTKVEYFNRRNELMKISTLENFKEYTVNGKKINYANKINMKNLQNNKMSVIEWKKRKIGVSLSKNIFKSTKLK